MSSRGGGDRQAVLIAGMHRSGTSAVTRVLNLLGAALPAELVGSFAGNELGHWEPAALPALHDRMLKDAGANVNSVTGFDRAWFDSPAAERAVDAVADYLESTFPDAPLFALKDPRMALFVPVWRRALQRLGIEPLFVLPFRAPREVAASLARRQLAVFPDSVWPPTRGELVWLSYVLEAERETRGARRAFVRFDALLEDWRAETARIGRQLEVGWPRSAEHAAAEVEAYLSREHKHENSDVAAATPLAGRVMALLEACVADPDAGGEAFDAAAQELDRARGLFGDYVAALESLVGGLPMLKTEFGDFPTALERVAASDPNASPEAERDRALMIAAAAERRVQAAVIHDLERVNAALTQAPPGGLTGGPDAASSEEADRLREEVKWLRREHGPLTLKIAAQRTLMAEHEDKARDARLAKEAAERRAAVLAEEVTVLAEAVTALAEENALNKARLSLAERERAAILGSTAWRLTGPARRLRALLVPGRTAAS